MIRLSDYLPNTSDRLALVHVDDERPFRAYWPMRFTQIIGGKRWSLSVCWRLTDKPVTVYERGAQGEFYPCKPDIFAATYEEVDDE